MNKKGRLLNEEGEAVGELVEGDIIDCVRQRVNGNGEVVDEYGRVVGTVRVIQPSTDFAARPMYLSAYNDAHVEGNILSRSTGHSQTSSVALSSPGDQGSSIDEHQQSEEYNSSGASEASAEVSRNVTDLKAKRILGIIPSQSTTPTVDFDEKEKKTKLEDQPKAANTPPLIDLGDNPASPHPQSQGHGGRRPVAARTVRARRLSRRFHRARGRPAPAGRRAPPHEGEARRRRQAWPRLRSRPVGVS